MAHSHRTSKGIRKQHVRTRSFGMHPAIAPCISACECSQGCGKANGSKHIPNERRSERAWPQRRIARFPNCAKWSESISTSPQDPNGRRVRTSWQTADAAAPAARGAQREARASGNSASQVNVMAKSVGHRSSARKSARDPSVRRSNRRDWVACSNRRSVHRNEDWSVQGDCKDATSARQIGKADEG